MCACSRAESCSFRVGMSVNAQFAHPWMFRVRANSFQGAQRETECVATFEARDRRRLSIPRRLQKRNNLRVQRLDVDDVEMLHVNAGPRATRRRWRETADRGALGRVVDRDVVVRLEKTHLA